MASKRSPGSSSSDHSEKKALLAQPETLEVSDDGTFTEAITESTTTSQSYDTASTEELSSEAESGQSGSNLPKDGSAEAAGELLEMTTGPAATERDESPLESEERDTAAENVPPYSPREPPPPYQPRSETIAAEIKRLIARGNPAVETTPLRIDPRSKLYDSLPHPQLVNPDEPTGVCFITSCFQCWQIISVHLSNSMFLLPFHALLLGIAISSTIIGGLNINKCPMANGLPVLIMFLGFFGFVAVILRMISVVHSNSSPSQRLRGKIRAWKITVNSLFILTNALEMWTFFNYTASFDVHNLDYCNPAFYYFTTILNYGLLIVLPLSFILHFPAIFSN